MSDVMSTHEDCQYWGLTWIQCSRYHSRLARYHGSRATQAADMAVHYWRRAQAFQIVAMVSLFVLFVLNLFIAIREGW